MTITDYSANLQALKINMQVEANVDKSELIEDKSEEAVPLPQNLLMSNESDYSNENQLKKSVIENILAGFGLDSSQAKLIPNDALAFSYESSSSNPYEQTLTQSANGLVYSSTEEFYEKTNIEFSGQIEVQTPQGNYQIDINFSYTREFYEKNTQEISYMHDNIQKPMRLDTNEFNDSFKDLQAIHLRFDILQEETQKNNKSLFEYLKEIIAKNDKQDDYKDKAIDNFEIWQKEVGLEYSMVAAQKDGVGIFIESAKMDASTFSFKANENGYSMQSSYSSYEMSSQSLISSYA